MKQDTLSLARAAEKAARPVAVMGAASIDIKARASGPVDSHGCLPGRIHSCPGGTARNIAENLARLSVRTSLLSVVGTDSSATDIVVHTALAGVDLSRILQTDRIHTATFLAVTDERGHVDHGVHDLGILEMLTADYVDRQEDLIGACSLVVTDSTPSLEALQRLQEACARHKVPMVLVPTAPLSVHKVRAVLSGSFLLALNRREAHALTDVNTTNDEGLKQASKQLIDQGVPLILITLDEEGVYYRSPEDEVRMPAFGPKVVDSMGAGDAFVAGFLYGFLHGLPLLKALEIGHLTAALTLDTLLNVHPKLRLDYIHSSVV